jgi:hypothetical protein
MPILAPLERPPPPSDEVVELGGAVLLAVCPACGRVGDPLLLLLLLVIVLELVVVVDEVDTSSTLVGTDAVTCIDVDVGV